MIFKFESFDPAKFAFRNTSNEDVFTALCIQLNEQMETFFIEAEDRIEEVLTDIKAQSEFNEDYGIPIKRI